MRLSLALRGTLRFRIVRSVWDSTGSMLYEQSVTNQHNQPSGITSMLVTNDGEPRSIWVRPTV